MVRGGKREGAGRKPGVPNKFTSDLKAMILGALDQAGGKEYLARQAEENPGPFMALVGKVLPTTLAGDPSSPIRHEHVIERDRAIVDALFAEVAAEEKRTTH